MANRQTASFLRRRFENAGIRPDSRRGQNFLIDLNLLELLLEASQVGPDEVALEIGTGLGSLTALLARRTAAVVTVEVDSRLQQLAAEQLIDFDNVTMLHQDALKNKNNLDPRVLDAVRSELEKRGAARYRLVANLPYNIATPVVSNLLSVAPLPASLTVTIQKELADRITARPANKDYGALSIWIQSQCTAAIVRTLPPTAFWPRPKVTSAIMHIVPDETRRARIQDPVFFHHFVRAIFLHRRKLLRAGLLSALGRDAAKPQVDQLLEQLAIAPQTRAEQLDVETLLKLSDAVQQLSHG